MRNEYEHLPAILWLIGVMVCLAICVMADALRHRKAKKGTGGARDRYHGVPVIELNKAQQKKNARLLRDRGRITPDEYRRVIAFIDKEPGAKLPEARKEPAE